MQDRAYRAHVLGGCRRPASRIPRLALGILLLAGSVYARRGNHPQALPSLVRQTDIMIWDEQVPGGLGWSVPADHWHAHAVRNSFTRTHYDIAMGIRHGRFGVLSGGQLYTTWRTVAPLANAAHVGGNTTIYEHHVSTLLTPPFEIKLPYVTFLLSGGDAPGEACVNLLVDPSSSNTFDEARAQVVRSATGRNSDLLEWVAFDVSNFVGRMARIQVVDASAKAFGYITIDCVCQSPDTKGAVRVIATPPPPLKVLSRADTRTGPLTGAAAIEDGRLLIGGKPVAPRELLSWDTGIGRGDAAGKRVELINGDAISGHVSGLEGGKLFLDSTIFGRKNLPLSEVAQVLFAPGPSVIEEPGTLIHANGSKIPGELSWIREDNISIKCTLGQLPLPRRQVRVFVVGGKTPVTAADTVVLADGSALSGDLTFEGERMALMHAVLGAVDLAMTDVVRVTRRQAGVTPLAGLRADVRERGGPVPPPAPLRVEDERGAALRMFPRTVARFTLPEAAAGRRFRGVLAAVDDARVAMTVQIRAGNSSQTYAVEPGGSGVAVDLDLGAATSFDLIVDATSTLSYPCGIEWRNAFIVEVGQP